MQISGESVVTGRLGVERCLTCYLNVIYNISIKLDIVSIPHFLYSFTDQLPYSLREAKAKYVAIVKFKKEKYMFALELMLCLHRFSNTHTGSVPLPNPSRPAHISILKISYSTANTQAV